MGYALFGRAGCYGMGFTITKYINYECYAEDNKGGSDHANKRK